MRLIRILHLRCNEYSDDGFIFAPDDWDNDRIEAEARAARDAYLEMLKQAIDHNDGPGFPGHAPPYDSYPSRTVAEVKAKFEEARAAYQEWDRQRRATRRNFYSFLEERGFISLYGDTCPVHEVEVDWGHRHGVPIDTSGGDTRDTWPTPAEMAEAIEERDA